MLALDKPLSLSATLPSRFQPNQLMPQIFEDSMPNSDFPKPGEARRGWAPLAGWSDKLIEQGFGSADWIGSTGSTNADLLSIPHQGQARAAALRWAGYQQAGRGRRGRRWVSQPGDALTFSIALERLIDERATKPVVMPAAFSLVAGLMVARSLETSPLTSSKPTLKWPNDVLLNGSKVAGILVEVSQSRPVQRLVVGIGLNLRPPRAQQMVDGPVHALAPVGLLDIQPDGSVGTCSPAQAAALVTEIALQIRQAHEVFFNQGLAPFIDDWLAHHAYHQQSVRLSDAENLVAEGVCTGIALDGAILIQVPEGQRSFAIGELSARPASALSNSEFAQ